MDRRRLHFGRMRWFDVARALGSLSAVVSVIAIVESSWPCSAGDEIQLPSTTVREHPRGASNVDLEEMSCRMPSQSTKEEQAGLERNAGCIAFCLALNLQ